MDALPPQAPRAVTAHASQASLDALQRLASTQRWLLEQQNLLPEAPAGTDGLDDFLGELDRFWSGSIRLDPDHTTTRRAAFASRIASTALDDAILRQLDGTLSDTAADMVRRFIRSSQADMPPGLHASALRIGGTTYAGALVLSDESHPATHLLFTTVGGWEVFASNNALLTCIETRLREALVTSGELPGVANPDIEPLLDGHVVQLTELDASPFEAMANRLIDRFRERLLAIWTHEGLDDTTRIDALHERLSLHDMLDLHALVEQRETALVAHAGEQRLASVPPIIREAWQTAAKNYHATLRRTAWDRHAMALDEPAPMVEVAREWLTLALHQQGYDVDVNDIRIRSTQVPLSPDAVFSTMSDGLERTTLSLVEFAFRNTGVLPTDMLTVLDATGQPRTDIPASTIREIVREIDLPSRYASHLDAVLGTSPEGKLQRALTGKLLRARLQLEAAEARLSYYDTSATRGFIDDHEERGFQWVRAVAEHPASIGRPKVGGHEIVVTQLAYQGIPMADVFVIGARQAKAVSRVVLYTPGAPDGIALREFDDRAQLARHFLLKSAYETYLLDRLPDAFASVNQRDRHFAVTDASRVAHWSLGSNGDCTDCTLLAAPFTEIEVTDDIFDTLYDTALSLARKNAYAHARPVQLADIDSVTDAVQGLRHLTPPYSMMLTPLLESPFRILPSLWQAYDDIKAGDHGNAFIHGAAAYTAALNIVPLYVSAPTLIPGAAMRITGRGGKLAATGQALPRPESLFDIRYQAADILLPAGPQPTHGVFTIAGKQYIRNQGKTYHVRFDEAIQGWRLNRPGAPDARFTGPAIERVAGNAWSLRRVGLLGGGRSAPYHMKTVGKWMRMRELLVPEVRALSFEQTLRLRDWLQRNVPVSANRIFRELSTVRPEGYVRQVSPIEAALWERALRYARTGRQDAAAGGVTPAAAPMQIESPPLTVSRPGPSRPRVASPAQGASAAPVPEHPVPGASLPVGMQRVPMHEWPETAYYYSSPLTAELWDRTGVLPLPQMRLMQGHVEGVPLLTLPPETPLGNIAGTPSAWMPNARGVAPALRLGAASGTWVRIDLGQVRARWPAAATRFEVLRPSTPGSTALVLRPLGNVTPDTTVTFMSNFTIHRWSQP